MLKKHFLSHSIALLFAGIMVGTACTPIQQPITINYVEYPSFFTSNDTYKTVVVGSVENALDPGKYETLVATNLMAKVQQNGAYKVIDVTKEKMSAEQLAAKGREKDPNALVLTSIITNYGEVRSSDLGSIGIYDSSSASATAATSGVVATNGRKAVAGASAYASASESRKSISLPVVNFTRGMYAKLNVILKRVADDEIIANEFVYSLITEKGFFGMNMSESEERLKRALDEMTTNAVYYLTPSVESMTIHPDDVLLIQKYGKDDWKNETDFGPEDTIRIVFVMSPRVAYNDFQITLKAAGVPDPISYQEVNYSGPVVLEYKASELMQATNGVLNYIVLATYGGQTISKRSFEIEVDEVEEEIEEDEEF